MARRRIKELQGKLFTLDNFNKYLWDDLESVLMMVDAEDVLKKRGLEIIGYSFCPEYLAGDSDYGGVMLRDSEGTEMWVMTEKSDMEFFLEGKGSMTWEEWTHF